MSKGKVVLSSEEKTAIEKILCRWVITQFERPYMSDAEYKEFEIVKRAYFNKFHTSTPSDI